MSWEGEVSFREDILAPANVIKIEYAGKDPFWICANALRLMREVLKLSSKDLREDDVRWDVTSENREFYGVWRAKRTEDSYSSTWVKITAHGFINRERVGSVKIKIEGWLSTDFEWSNPLARWAWIMFNYLFYWRQRRTYIDKSKDDIMTIRENILRAYKILKE
ncbi:MAG: hypothetical protein QW548_00235 [Candidatus Aenigmatarchaeota archaeon]